MQQINSFKYRVTPQENVTVSVTPSVEAGMLFTANLDGHAMDNPANGIYKFTVTRPAGSNHFFLVDFDFTAAPPESQFQVVIDGDGLTNKGPFTVNVPDGADPDQFETFMFQVV